MDKRPSSPQPKQVHQMVEKGSQIKRYISNIVGQKILGMQGRPPAQFGTTYKNRDDTKHPVDLTEKNCNRILLACGMTLIMLLIGASIVGGILLTVIKLDDVEETATVSAINLNIKCPRDIVTRTVPGGRHAVVSWEKPELQTVPSDVNASAVTFESNYEPNTSFAIGDHEVVYTVTDFENNQETCSFKVKIRDKERPVFIRCPKNIKIVTDESDGSFPDQTWDTPKATDNAGPPRITTNHGGSRPLELGTTVIRYTATDAAGNFARCVFEVTIIDGTPPMILGCPEDLTDTTGTGRPEWRQPTAVDNGQLVSFNSDWTSGDIFPRGRTRVTYVAEDWVGLKAECSFVVAVVDMEAPVFTNCPTNITVTTGKHGFFKAPTWQTPRAADGSGTPRITTNHGGEEFQLGRATEIVYVATDLSGNNAKCSFYVMVKDGTPPTIHGCPPDITQPTDRGTPTAHVYWSPPTARDNGDLADFDSNKLPGDIFSLGATTVVYTAVDSAGLNNVCSFTVTIRDLEAPKFNFCPPNIEKNTDRDGNFDPPTWPVPIATDNNGPPQVTTAYKFGEFLLGVKTPVRYIATDASGNNATCLFYVIVIDETPPTMSECPLDITITTDRHSPTGRCNWTAPTATDNGDHVTLTSNADPGDGFHIGRTRVTYTAVDNAGLTTNCHFTLTVQDNEDPVFTHCPADIFRTTDASGNYAYPIWKNPEAEDNSGNPPEIVTTHRVQMYELNSRTRIKYTATDASGNNATCVFHVSVTDGTPPEMRNCPDDITLSTDPNTSTSRVNWSLPRVSDNSRNVNLTSDQTNGDLFPLGSTVVTFTAADPSGLTTKCHFTVTVIDTEDPVFTQCPLDIEKTTGGKGIYDMPVWETPKAFDNSGQVEVSTTFDFAPFELGVTTPIEYTATDPDDNKATCIFFVTISDGARPVLSECPRDITLPTDPHLPTARVNWTEPTAKDNSGYARLTSNLSPGESFPLGKTKVVYTAMDAAGLRDRCRFTVTVEDIEAPVFDSCPQDIVEKTNVVGKFNYPTWPYPHAVDNSGVSPGITTTSTYLMFPLEEAMPIEYLATDQAGNTASCKFYVTVKDCTPPVITECPADMTVSIDPRTATGRAIWISPVAMDNGQLVSFVSDWDSGDSFPAGETNVTYVALDSVGLTSRCQFTVIVEARCNLSLSTPAMKNNYKYRFPFPIARPSTNDSPTPLRFDFAVRSTGTVFLALAEAGLSTDVYEIGLARSKSFIREGVQRMPQHRPHYVTVMVPDLISATKYRRFWVTYDGRRGLVRVGSGSQVPFMEWQDPSPTPLDIQRIGIASYQAADWKGYLCRNTTSRGMSWLL